MDYLNRLGSYLLLETKIFNLRWHISWCSETHREFMSSTQNLLQIHVVWYRNNALKANTCHEYVRRYYLIRLLESKSKLTIFSKISTIGSQIRPANRRLTSLVKEATETKPKSSTNEVCIVLSVYHIPMVISYKALIFIVWLSNNIPIITSSKVFEICIYIYI